MIESMIESWTQRRDTIATQIKSQLGGAEFGGVPINESAAASLIRSAHILLGEAEAFSNHSDLRTVKLRPPFENGRLQFADARF